jgi:hypothetical protein
MSNDMGTDFLPEEQMSQGAESGAPYECHIRLCPRAMARSTDLAMVLPKACSQTIVDPDVHLGSFNCKVCGTEVHAWSANHEFFDWKVDQAKSFVFGKEVTAPLRPRYRGR